MQHYKPLCRERGSNRECLKPFCLLLKKSSGNLYPKTLTLLSEHPVQNIFFCFIIDKFFSQTLAEIIYDKKINWFSYSGLVFLWHGRIRIQCCFAARIRNRSISTRVCNSAYHPGFNVRAVKNSFLTTYRKIKQNPDFAKKKHFMCNMFRIFQICWNSIINTFLKIPFQWFV